MKMIFNYGEHPCLFSRLKKAGIRMTGPRRRVLEVLAQADVPLSPQEIYQALQSTYPDALGLTSVYRTLALLEDMNLLRRIDSAIPSARYELLPSEDPQASVLLCRRCQKPYGPFSQELEAQIQKLRQQLEGESGYAVSRQPLIFYGICPACGSSGDGAGLNREVSMKIAIAEEGNQVSGHFGHCSRFLLAEIENGLVMKREWIDNPAHVPGKLPLFLEEQGVTVIIAGAMGQMARQLFDARGIDQVVGVTGSVDKALEDFVTGSLEQGENLCSGGHHNGGGHSCGGHS